MVTDEKTASTQLAQLEQEIRELEQANVKEGGFSASDPRAPRLLALLEEADEIETGLLLAGL